MKEAKLSEREKRETCSNCGRRYTFKFYEIRAANFLSLYDYQCCYMCLAELVKWIFNQAHLDGLWGKIGSIQHKHCE